MIAFSIRGRRSPAKAPPVQEATVSPQLQRRPTADFLPPLASLAAVPALPGVQRKCGGGCEAAERDELPVQPRLEVGPVGDRYEREADSIADTVMAMRETEAGKAAASVQRAAEGAGGEEEEESSVMPRLEVGPVGDRFEREADGIAAQVMAMREADVSGAAPSVQRACSACSASDDEPRARRQLEGAVSQDEDEPIRARRAGGGNGGETIAASHGDLTGGGSALPASTQGFFESRMGRDLSDVRVHEGSASQSLNGSISARAFTYQNHIWLGRGESASPSFTMAHELAHVMQQTAPGPVGPAPQRSPAVEAEAAEPAIQRKHAPFWLPEGVGTGGQTLTQQTIMHNAALRAIRANNSQVMSEVPIPGGNRKGTGPKRCGFADLYTAAGDPVMVPGIEVVDVPAPPAGAGTSPSVPGETAPPPDNTAPATSQPAAPPSPIAELNNFKLGESLTSCVDRIGMAMQQGGAKKGTVNHESRRAPKISGGRLTDIPLAPTKIRIGEMKPAHDLDYRDSGVKQINNYITGIENTADKVNSVASAMGENARWDPGATDIGADLKMPAGWDAEGTITDKWPINSIKIRYYKPTKRKITAGAKKGKTKRSVKAKDSRQGRPKTEAIRGRWKMAIDPDRSGLFVYFLAPNPDDLAKALATPSTRPEFRALAGKIDVIQKALYASPKPTPVTGAGTVTPLRIEPHAAKPAAPVVARADRDQPAVRRKEVKDPFKAADWEAKRTGAGLKQGATDDSLLAAYEAIGDEERGEIAETGGMAEWLKEQPGGADPAYAKVKVDPTATTDLKILKSVDFWTGLKAKPFGILREKFGKFFGTAFKKIHDFGERMQAKFKEKKEKDLLGKGPKGTIMKAAAKVASVVLPRIAIPFLKSMYNTIIQCGQMGFEKKFKELISGTVIEDVITLADELRDKVDAMADDIEGYLAKLVEDTIGPLKKEFDAYIEEAKLVMSVAQMIAELAKAARIGSCVAGLIAAPETVGIGAVVGCGAALGDYILSKFGLSPIEYFIAWTLQSCETQNAIGKMMAGVDFIKTLPKAAGIAVVRKVKTLLKDSGIPGEFGGKSVGHHASELFCDPDDAAFAAQFKEMAYEPTNCSDTGYYKGSKSGSYDIPADVRLYKKGDPKGPEKKWIGKDGSEEATPAPPPPKPPATPPQTPPTTPPAGGGGGEKKAELVDTVHEGHVENAQPAMINLEIRAGFNPKKAYDGSIAYPVALIGTDNNGIHYGPVTVNVFVFAVTAADPGWTITFKFQVKKGGDNIVLKDAMTGQRFEIFDSGTKKITVKLRGVNSTEPAAPPAETEKKK
jgi:uncharacterized protein DUF4157